MGNSTDADTPADHLESAILGVRQPTEEYGQRISDKLEGLSPVSGLVKSFASMRTGNLHGGRYR